MLKNIFFISGTIAFILLSVFLFKNMSGSSTKQIDIVDITPTYTPSVAPILSGTPINPGTPSGKAGTVAIDEKRFKDVPKRIGPENPELKLVIFGDIYEPFTTRFFEETYMKLREKYPTMQLIFHYASAVNQQKSIKMGSILECSARQGKFWGNISPAIQNEENMDSLTYLADVNIDEIRSCLNDSSLKVNLLESDNYAGELGVEGTPTFFLINAKSGKVDTIVGAMPIATFEEAIDKLLKSN